MVEARLLDERIYLGSARAAAFADVAGEGAAERRREPHIDQPRHGRPLRRASAPTAFRWARSHLVAFGTSLGWSSRPASIRSSAPIQPPTTPRHCSGEVTRHVVYVSYRSIGRYALGRVQKPVNLN